MYSTIILYYILVIIAPCAGSARGRPCRRAPRRPPSAPAASTASRPRAGPPRRPRAPRPRCAEQSRSQSDGAKGPGRRMAGEAGRLRGPGPVRVAARRLPNPHAHPSPPPPSRDTISRIGQGRVAGAHMTARAERWAPADCPISETRVLSPPRSSM